MYRIEKATLAEAALIADIGARSFIESHGHSGPEKDIEAYVSEKFSVATIRKELSDTANIFHVIYHDNKAAGYSKIIFNTPHALIKEQNVTKLERLYLLKEFYALKLGATLFGYIKDLSGREQQSGMWLYVWKKNERAGLFYEKAGFKIIGSGDFKISETHANPNHIMYLKY